MATDIQLRGIVLQQLYEKRGTHHYTPESDHFDPPLPISDVVRICKQLSEHTLVNAQFINVFGGQQELLSCDISARGVDVIETGSSPDLRIDLMSSSTINITGSSNVVVGNNNQVTVLNSVHELVKVIDSCNATTAEKAEAKSLLKSFLAHPVVAAVAGGAMALL